MPFYYWPIKALQLCSFYARREMTRSVFLLYESSSVQSLAAYLTRYYVPAFFSVSGFNGLCSLSIYTHTDPTDHSSPHSSPHLPLRQQ